MIEKRSGLLKILHFCGYAVVSLDKIDWEANIVKEGVLVAELGLHCSIYHSCNCCDADPASAGRSCVGASYRFFFLQPGIANTLSKMSDYILTAIGDKDNLRIIVLLYVFGGLVGMMHIAGGVKGFANLVQKRIKTEGGALLVTWGTVLITFMDCEFRIMTTGSVMKSVKNTINVMRSKLAYAIDVSTVPVIVLIPIATTYVGNSFVHSGCTTIKLSSLPKQDFFIF